MLPPCFKVFIKVRTPDMSAGTIFSSPRSRPASMSFCTQAIFGARYKNFAGILLSSQRPAMS